MIVIADTSPINYLVLIDAVEVLPALYGRVLVPPSVCAELQRARASDRVRTWIAQPPPGWRYAHRADLPTRNSPASTPGNAMPFCWRRNWGRINSLSMKFAGGERRSAADSPSPAPWASWPQPPRTGYWT